MPITSGSAGGIPGMNLKAWAYVNAAGALVRGYNIASVVKGAAGRVTLNFTAAMSGTEYIARCTCSGANEPGTVGNIASRAIGSCTAITGYLVKAGGVSEADMSALWEIYE